MSESDPDLSLVRALQDGDERALDELMTRHQGPLLGMIYRHVGDSALARDLLQETFVRAYFGIGQFKPQAKFISWLCSIATNLCRDHARSKRGRQARVTRSFDEMTDMEREIPDASAQSSQPDDAMEKREALEALDEAIGQLPHDLKAALILFALEGRPQQECAEILGVTPKAVETRVYRARKILESRISR